MYERSSCGRSSILTEEVLRKKNCAVFFQLLTAELLLLLLLLNGGSREPWEEQLSHSQEKRHKQRLGQEGKGFLDLCQI